jgi:hypothetical protein
MTILQKSLLGGLCLTSLLVVNFVRPNSDVRSQFPQTLPYEDLEIFNAKISGEVLTEVELYFGLSKPDKTAVSEIEWQRFVEHEITPRFGDGITVWSAYGQYRDSSGELVKEDSKIVVLIYENNLRRERDIQAIIDAYIPLPSFAEGITRLEE